MLRIECIMFHGTIVNIEIDQFSIFKKDFRWEIQVKWIKHCFYCTLVEKKIILRRFTGLSLFFQVTAWFLKYILCLLDWIENNVNF